MVEGVNFEVLGSYYVEGEESVSLITPSEITQFYCSQFQGNDCKIKNNY